MALPTGQRGELAGRVRAGHLYAGRVQGRDEVRVVDRFLRQVVEPGVLAAEELGRVDRDPVRLRELDVVGDLGLDGRRGLPQDVAVRHRRAVDGQAVGRLAHPRPHRDVLHAAEVEVTVGVVDPVERRLVRQQGVGQRVVDQPGGVRRLTGRRTGEAVARFTVEREREPEVVGGFPGCRGRDVGGNHPNVGRRDRRADRAVFARRALAHRAPLTVITKQVIDDDREVVAAVAQVNAVGRPRDDAVRQRLEVRLVGVREERQYELLTAAVAEHTGQ